MIIYSPTKKVLFDDSPSVDAFSRLRVADPYSIFDSKQLHDSQPLIWDESLGPSATSVHSAINANTRISVDSVVGDFAIRQTKNRFNYQPGKSQLILFTFYAEQQSGITQRVGAFDGTGANFLTPNNGIYFESTNNSFSWNIAKNGSTTESITQSNWNVDKLDGTGKSGITLDLSAAQIGIIDYEWLGVGRVRAGFIIDGVVYYCHYFNHANNSSFNSVFMSTPNLPVRFDITTDGSNSGLLEHICCSIISEGGIEKTGVARSIDSGVTVLDANVVGSAYAALGIRLKSTHLDITVEPEFVSLISATNDNFRWSLHINPTVAGTFTFNDLSNSGVQYAVGTTANTLASLQDGVVINSGYGSKDTRQVEVSLRNALRIGSNIDGTRDILVLAVSPLTSNLDIIASLNFRELI